MKRSYLRRTGFKKPINMPLESNKKPVDETLLTYAYPDKAKSAKRLKSGKNRPKPQNASKLKEGCDKLIKDIIKIRDKHTCQKCGKQVSGSDCHGSHVVPVSAGNKLRWDEQNLKVLCYHCHLNWWHKNPIEATEWFKEKFPERYSYLQANKGMISMKLLDFTELKDKLQIRLKEISNN